MLKNIITAETFKNLRAVEELETKRSHLQLKNPRNSTHSVMTTLKYHNNHRIGAHDMKVGSFMKGGSGKG